jgi:hypothetical protein
MLIREVDYMACSNNANVAFSCGMGCIVGCGLSFLLTAGIGTAASALIGSTTGAGCSIATS